MLYGGGALLADPHGTWQLAGFTKGSELRFENVMAAKAGTHVLRINYYAGPTGTATVRMGDAKGIPAKLSGVGMWGATKPGDALAREILVTLEKGANQISLLADETLPPIKELILTFCP